MMLLSATIYGHPVGKERPRFSRGAPGSKPRTYTPKKTATWEATAATVMRGEWGRPNPWRLPVAVVVRAVSARPQDEVPGPRVLAAHPGLSKRLWRPVKPDVDNVAKAALDALVLAGVLEGDQLVVSLTAESLWTALGEGPRVEIEVRQADPGAMPRRCW